MKLLSIYRVLRLKAVLKYLRVPFAPGDTLFFFYKNIFYKNIEAEICEILRIL